jgi:site-specific DNA-methyltransferase (adenine-specific)
MNESERQYHDVSNIFPMMSDEEFDALKQDIKAQGLLEPIWIHADGSIIDGRNRHRACVELGVTPLFRTYQGENPAAFSISQNIKRRHLTDSQRAMIAVQALPMLQAEAKAKMIASGAKGGAFGVKGGDGRGNKKPPEADLPQGVLEASSRAPQSRDIAAAAVGVSPRLVQNAKAVSEKSPELAEKVKTGELAIDAALREVKKINQQEKHDRLDGSAESSQTTLPDAVIIHHADARTLASLVTEPVQFVVTSPPYNVGIDYATHDDAMSADDYQDLLHDVFGQCWQVMEDGARIAVVVPFGTGRNPWMPVSPIIYSLLKTTGFTLRGQIIWDKNTTGNRTSWGSFRMSSNPAIRDTTEAIIIAHKGDGNLAIPENLRCVDAKGTYTGALSDSNYFMELSQDHWVIAPESAQRVGHPAPFPIELAKRLIDLYAYPGAHVLDPFGGSGTTAIAAMRCACRATLVEIDEGYCRLTKRRLVK